MNTSARIATPSNKKSGNWTTPLILSAASGWRAIASAAAAENLKEDIVSKAKTEADSQIEKAKTQINVEKDKAMQEIRSEVVNLSIDVAEKIIKKNISKEDNIALIKESLSDVKNYEA